MSSADLLDVEPPMDALARLDGSDVIIDVAQVAPRLELGAEEFLKALPTRRGRRPGRGRPG